MHPIRAHRLENVVCLSIPWSDSLPLGKDTNTDKWQESPWTGYLPDTQFFSPGLKHSSLYRAETGRVQPQELPPLIRPGLLYYKLKRRLATPFVKPQTEARRCDLIDCSLVEELKGLFIEHNSSYNSFSTCTKSDETSILLFQHLWMPREYLSHQKEPHFQTLLILTWRKHWKCWHNRNRPGLSAALCWTLLGNLMRRTRISPSPSSMAQYPDYSQRLALSGTQLDNSL